MKRKSLKKAHANHNPMPEQNDIVSTHHIKNDKLVDLNDEKLRERTRNHAKEYDIDFDSLPLGIKTTMAMSQYLEDQTSTENFEKIVQLQPFGSTYQVTIPTGNPATYNMLPVYASYPDAVQLTISNLLENHWLDRILNDNVNILDDIKVKIVDSINNLSNRNLHQAFFLNLTNAFYALVERAIKVLESGYGISIDIPDIINHTAFKEFINATFNANDIFEYVFKSAPIPVTIRYVYDDEVMSVSKETVMTLREMSKEEYDAVVETIASVKSVKLASEFYYVFAAVLRDVVYHSDTMNGYLDLSTLYNLCLTNISFLFNDLAMQIKVFIVQATSVALYNAEQVESRQGLIFEIEEED